MDHFSLMNLGLIFIFVVGYALIAFEHSIHLNKAAVALTIGVLCWTLVAVTGAETHEQIVSDLSNFISADAQIILFLIGALTIVEIIHLHRGFALITDIIAVDSKKGFLWIICALAFVLSAVIDNLTTTVVIISIIAKLVPERKDRIVIGGAVVVAANAGGAFSPIGDVTTTMLWIDGKITALATMRDLFLPSVVCFVVSTALLTRELTGKFEEGPSEEDESLEHRGALVFFVGIFALVSVPLFKFWTGLPPMMGVLLGLGILWLLTDWLHQKFDRRRHLLIPVALSRIDTSSILFFMGILLSVSSLEHVGLLHELAGWLQHTFATERVIALLLGFLSAIIDNVPLVAASMGMYNMSQFPVDSQFWQLIAYCAGTGGSMLVIGSAAGVVYMGFERVQFFWYLRKIAPAALAGYLGGIAVYLLFTG